MTALTLVVVLSVGAIVPAHALDPVTVASLAMGGVQILMQAAQMYLEAETDAERQAALDEMLKLWDSSVSSSVSIEISAEVLQDVCMELNNSGFPCEIVWNSSIGGFVIQGLNYVYIPGVIESRVVNISGKYYSNVQGYTYYSVAESHTTILERIDTYLYELNLALTADDGLFDLWFTLFDSRLKSIEIWLEMLEVDLYTGDDETESIAQKIDRLIESVEGIGSVNGSTVNFDTTPITDKLTAINNRLLTTSGDVQYTVAELVRNLWTAQLTANDRLGTLAGYVDQVEGRLLRTVDDVQYTVADTTYNAWQQLKTLSGYVDGLEASALTANNLLHDLVGNVDGVEGTLSSVLHWLQVDAYGDQDVYAIMSGMVYNFVYGTSDQQTVIQSVWDKYWLTEEQMLAATFRVQLSADDLRDMQRRFNEAGIPTEVRYLEDAGIYVLRSAGNARAVDFDDFSQSQSQVAGLNTYPRFFSNAGCLYYAAEAGSSTSLHNLNGKMGTVIQRLDTLIANQGQNLEADITVDLGDITISSDDTTLTAYIKMLAYGQQDMYSSLAAIAAEYRDASASDKSAMDQILLNYWYTPGSNIGQVYFPGDALRSIHQHMVEIGYPCLVVWDSSLEAYVIKLTGNPRVSDVFDFSYTGAYSGKQNLYQDGTVYYLTQGGYLLSSRNDGTEASIDSMAVSVQSALDGLSSDLATYYSGESFYLDGLVTFSMNTFELLDEKLPALETTLSTVGANIVTAIEDASAVCPHEYTSQIVVEPSCELPGVMKYTCDLCSAFYYEDVAALGHSWTDVAGGGDSVPQEEVLIPPTTVPANYEMVFPDYPAPIEGDLYHFVCDGQDYYTRATVIAVDGAGFAIALGDLGAITGSGPSTGEPFTVTYDDATGETVFSVVGNETVELALYHVVEPAEFVAVKEIEYIPLHSMNVNTEQTYGIPSLVLGDLYRISYNGQNYFSFPNVYMDAGGGTYLTLGDMRLIDGPFGSYSCDDPFVVASVTDGSLELCSWLLSGFSAPSDFGVYRVLDYTYSSGEDASSLVRTCTRCHAGEDMAALVSFLDAKLDALESALANAGDIINIENNTNIDISEENESYNIFFVEDTDGEGDQSIIDLSGDALTVFGKLLNFLYQVGFKDALDGAGPGIGDLSDFYLDDSEGSVDLWAS